MLVRSGRFRLRIALLLSVLSALIVTGLAPANAVDLSDASISGKVTAPAGVDLASTQVYAHTASGYSYTGYSQVSEDGTYSISGLPAGTYKVQFSGSNYSGGLEQWHAGASSFETATTVTLAAGQSVTGINANLVKGASISGRITVPAGVDLNSVDVSVRSTGDEWYSAYGSVNQDGSYSVRGLPAGSYKIQFAGGNSGAITQWHSAASSFEAATPITLTAGQDLGGINASLVKGASISGAITVPAGVDPSRVHVEARDANGNTAGYSNISSEGTYSLRGFPAGSYKVLFSSYDTGLLQQWYSGASSFDAATPVVLAAGQEKTGIDASLVTGGSVSGRVTAPAGINLSSIQATVYEAAGSNPNYVASSSVNADGTYTVGGLNTRKLQSAVPRDEQRAAGAVVRRCVNFWNSHTRSCHDRTEPQRGRCCAGERCVHHRKGHFCPRRKPFSGLALPLRFGNPVLGSGRSSRARTVPTNSQASPRDRTKSSSARAAPEHSGSGTAVPSRHLPPHPSQPAAARI
jgi:hypothetical protein